MRDECFIRGSVPMTKEEIRALVISKLDLERESVLWDIGAGTGSVSVEASRKTPVAKIIAFEKNPEGIELIYKNIEKFSCRNIEVIEGTFPDDFNIQDFDMPTHVFIGGSDGRIKQIIDQLRELNPNIKIVISSVTLETIAALTEYIRERELPVETAFVSVSKTKTLGNYHMLQGANPVAIFTMGGCL